MVIDKIGRKPLLLIGSVGMAVTLGAMTWAFAGASTDAAGNLMLDPSVGWVALVAANLYVIFFNFSWGPVMWVMLGEMFPNQIRGSALAVAGLAQWAANFAVVQSFPWMADNLGLASTYAFYTVSAVISFFLVKSLRQGDQGQGAGGNGRLGSTVGRRRRNGSRRPRRLSRWRGAGPRRAIDLSCIGEQSRLQTRSRRRPRRRHRRMDERGRAGRAARPAGRSDAGRERGHRHRRRRRSHPAAYPRLRRTARHRRGRVHAGDPCDLQAGDRLPRLRTDRRKLRPPFRHLRRGSRRRALPPLLAGDAAAGPGGSDRQLFAGRHGGAGEQVPPADHRCQPDFDLRLRLPVRRDAVRARSCASTGRSSGSSGSRARSSK